jgi:hypothetical protein
MTTKDYVIIARAIRLASEQAAFRAGQTGVDMEGGIEFVRHYMEKELGKDNPKFSGIRFYNESRLPSKDS